jgi:aryl-alcohol dehydrogenase-like predicted oxidoreductase
VSYDTVQGWRLLTSSSIYGDNEELLGKWFKRTGKRNEIFLASKFGIVMEAGLQFKGIDSSAEYCKKCCNESLEKLGIDCIDICACIFLPTYLYEANLNKTMSTASIPTRRSKRQCELCLNFRSESLSFQNRRANRF